MASFIQLLVSGLATGAIYALIAVGFTLLWQTSQTINFAQGEFVMLPAFFVLAAMNAGAPFWLACLIGIALSIVILGVLFKLIIVDPMLKYGVLPLVISTIALSLFLKESAKDFYSSQAQPFPALVPATDIHFFDAVVSTQSLAVLAVAILTVAALSILLNKTRLGPRRCRRPRKIRRWRASSASRCSGWCSTRFCSMRCWSRSPRSWSARSISPNSPTARRWAWPPSLRRSSADSIRCAAPFSAACILGVLDNLSAAYISSQYRGAFPLIILIAVILLRPQGLLGRLEERTV